MSKIKRILLYSTFSLILLGFLMTVIVNPSIALQPSPNAVNTTPRSAASAYENIFIEDINRNYEVNDYGLVIIEDTYQILNNRSSSLSYLDICISDFEWDRLVFYKGTDSAMAVNALSEKINGYSVLEIIFTQPILPYSTLNVSLTLVFKDLFDYDSTYSAYDLDVYVLPVSPYKILTYTSTVNIQTGSTGLSINPDTAIETDSETQRVFVGVNVFAFTEATVQMIYQNTQVATLKLNSVERTIVINPWGYINVEEEHYISSESAPYTSSFVLRIPGNAIEVNASDDLGAILGVSLAADANEDGTKNVTFSLTQNRALLLEGKTMYYRIEYSLPFEEYYTKDLLVNNFRIDLFTTKVDFLIENQTTNIQIIGASSIDRINIDVDSQEKTNQGLILTLSESDISPFHTNHVDITFKVNVFVLIYRAIIFMLIIAVILGAYVVINNKVKSTEGTVEEYVESSIPIRELRQFVTLYEEKNALNLDIEKTDEDLIRRKIQKKAYNKQIKDLNQKIKEIDVEITPFKTELLQAEGKIQSIIQKLDYLEAEKVSIKDSVRLLQERYKRGKLPSKAAYERLNEDLIKRLSSAQNKIDRNINELRAYLI